MHQGFAPVPVSAETLALMTIIVIIIITSGRAAWIGGEVGSSYRPRAVGMRCRQPARDVRLKAHPNPLHSAGEPASSPGAAGCAATAPEARAQKHGVFHSLASPSLGGWILFLFSSLEGIRALITKTPSWLCCC